MFMRRILINAANLHVGGAVQVAVSFIDELSNISPLPSGLEIWASNEVDENLRSLGTNIGAFDCYKVVDKLGLKEGIFLYHKTLRSFDVVFTVFGPLYVWGRLRSNICGFAQPWIIYPDNEINDGLNWRYRWVNRLKFKLQSCFFKQANQLVVELDHVRSGLLKRGIGNSSAIHVVRNCLSSMYFSPESWRDVDMPDHRSDIKLGFVGRNYTHKNTVIFPQIINILRRDYGVLARIYVTFTDDEWANCSDEFRATVTNVGPLLVNQCPAFYKQIDGVIFPSLLECFSAAPLEAMAMGKPLFASDRPFNRDVCGEHAQYFDPLLPASAAAVIAQQVLDGRGGDRETLREAQKHAATFSTAGERAEQYLALIMQEANRLNDEGK